MSKSIASNLLGHLNLTDKTVLPPSQTPSTPALVRPSSPLPSHQPDDPRKVEHDYQVRYVPLNLLQIDFRQPRKYLPLNLREQLASGSIDAFTVVKHLIEQSAQGDIVASGFLGQIQELARNIREVGLQQPLRVSPERPKSQQTVFRIVDGERRYWAYIWLETIGLATTLVEPGIPVILYKADASAEEIQQAQWAVNLHREDIPAVDYAEAVWRVREDYFSRLSIDRNRYVSELGAAAQGLSLHDIASLLTCQEIERLTGRKLKRSSFYLYLAIAEKLSVASKALARAHGISLRQLRSITGYSESRQIEAILRMIDPNRAETLIQPQPSRRSDSVGRPGRPTSLQRSVNTCINLVNALQKMPGKALAKQTPEDKQAFLAELDMAAAEVDRVRKLIKAQLTA